MASPSHSENLRSDWSHLPPDLQFYLAYFYENVTHLHYSLKTDGNNNFLRTLFLDAALRNEALLHAVVGFSAFQLTLYNPDGKIQDFLQYYNKAVSLLLNSLKRGETHSTGTLLAILQLATIEVSKDKTSCISQLTVQGIPWGLDQLARPSKSRVRNTNRAIHSSNSYAERTKPCHTWMVHAI